MDRQVSDPTAHSLGELTWYLSPSFQSFHPEHPHKGPWTPSQPLEPLSWGRFPDRGSAAESPLQNRREDETGLVAQGSRSDDDDDDDG